jgi:hypothetical protein
MSNSDRSHLAKILRGLLIIVLGLFVFAGLVFGACLLA